jgi:hypothetical protein
VGEAAVGVDLRDQQAQAVLLAHHQQARQWEGHAVGRHCRPALCAAAVCQNSSPK